MTSFIRISNQADNVNRLYLEKLGLSTKRDNEETIGQFGSGSKFAPIAALRKDWRWVNIGSDELGDYQMEYISIEENGINSIYYRYTDPETGEVKDKPSSFTLEAGVLSWDFDFQIFREAFANALDEYTENGVEYRVEIVDEIVHEDGVFAVYLTASPELLEIVEDFDKYFCLKREPVLELRGVKVFEPYDGENNIYFKNVLVHNDVRHIPIFDYMFDNITLNEERRVRDTYDLTNKFVSTVMTLQRETYTHDEKALYVVKKWLQGMNKKKWETSFSGYHGKYVLTIHTDNVFKRAFFELFGDNAVIYQPDSARYIFNLEVRNMKGVEVASEFWYEVLSNCGVPTLHSVSGDEIEFEFVELSAKRARMLNDARSVVDQLIPTSCASDYKVFAPQNDQDKALGMVRDGRIFLSIHAFASMQDLIATVYHECSHIKTGYSDDDQRFRVSADEDVASLLMEKWERGQ